MNKIGVILLLIFGFFSAQEKTLNSLSIERNQEVQPFEEVVLEENKMISEIENANIVLQPKVLNPTKAGLYSAVLPGLGQYYNKKYWKIPIVWGAIGTGVGVSIWYSKQYKRYRSAFVAELNGMKHEFSDRDWITAETLGNTQDAMKRRRDYAIAITGLVYILNIIDAVVDAHLYQGKNDPDLAIKPTIIYNEYTQTGAMGGVSLNFKF